MTGTRNHGATVAAFNKLNPGVGDPVPYPPSPPRPRTSGQGGGDVQPPEIHHPRSPRPPRLRHPLLSTHEPDPPPAQLKTEQVVRKVRSLDLASAAGLSGTSYKTLRMWFLENDKTSDALTVVLNHILAANVPQPIINLLNAGRGVAIPKSENDVRPVVVGHAITRLLGSLSPTSVRDDAASFFTRPVALQFGRSLPGGTELMAATIGAYLDEHPDAIVCSSDAKNAFNTWSRTAMWSQLRTHFPSLYAFVRLVYGSSSTILFPDPLGNMDVVMNSVGSRQGCSLGSFLYCLAIHEPLSQLQREFPDLLILGYADDVAICGESTLVIKAYHRWAFLYSDALQGELRHDKGKIYAPSVTRAALLKASPPTDIPVVHDGIRVLGAPIGSDSFILSFVDKHLTDLEDTFITLGRMPHLQSQFVLAQRSLAHRTTHLLRNLPHGGDPIRFASCRARYNQLMLQVPRRITGRAHLDSRAEELCGFVTRHGGLGLRTWQRAADSAFLASYVSACFHLPSLFPNLTHHFPDVRSLVPCLPGSLISLQPNTPVIKCPSRRAAAAAAALVRLLPSAPGLLELLTPRDLPPRQLQFQLSAPSDDHAYVNFASALVNPSDPHAVRHQAYYRSSCGDSHTFGTVPTDTHTTHSNAVFSVMTARKLLLPLPKYQKDQACVCPSCKSSQPDPFGDHAVVCKGNLTTRTRRWHDPLVQCFLTVCRTAGHRAKDEVSNHMVLVGFRPDVAIYHPTGDTVTDVRTCDPMLLPEASLVNGAAAAHGERIKDNKWRPYCDAQGDRFVALACESGGRLGLSLLGLLSELTGSSGGSRGECSALTTWSLQRLHNQNMAGVAALIIDQAPVPTGPASLAQSGILSFAAPPAKRHCLSSRSRVTNTHSRPSWAPSNLPPGPLRDPAISDPNAHPFAAYNPIAFPPVLGPHGPFLLPPDFNTLLTHTRSPEAPRPLHSPAQYQNHYQNLHQNTSQPELNQTPAGREGVFPSPILVPV